MKRSNKNKRNSLQQKIARGIFLARKDFRSMLRPSVSSEKQMLFILGCQRSGTTLMTKIMEKDWDAKVYPEHSKLSSDDHLDNLRLNSLPKVKSAIARNNYPLVVLKPLVESQNTDRLLDSFKGSKAIWMIRFYKDVAASNLARFGMGNGIKNLRYIAADENQNWRAERLPQYVRELVKSHFSEGMNPYDAAALFWYVRNTLFFDLALDRDPSVRIYRYSDLVTSPNAAIRDIYRYVNCPYPGDQILSGIHTSSIGKGGHIELSEEIDDLCQGMWERLLSVSPEPINQTVTATHAPVGENALHPDPLELPDGV